MDTHQIIALNLRCTLIILKHLSIIQRTSEKCKKIILLLICSKQLKTKCYKLTIL